ncbi:MAG: hydantoinase/oxoprolinase family protein [Bacillota bacterium]
MEKGLTPSAWRLAVDFGGASTGGCAYVENSGEIFTMKVPSTPENPASAVAQLVAGMSEKTGLPMESLDTVILGTTLASGSLTQGRGAKTALLVTRGFRDILHLGGEPRPYLYDLGAEKHPPIVGRRFTFEINERVLPGGRVAVPLDDSEILNLVPCLVDNGIESVAVCFLHSYCNPRHEQRARDILTKHLPTVPVTISSDILPLAGEYQRAATTVINAAIRPLLGRYLDHTGKCLAGYGAKAAKFFVMQSDGSLIAARQAREESARTVLSGPAGGVLACLQLAKISGRPRLIVFDMGATGARFSIIHSDHLPVADGGTAAGHPARLPMLDILTTGAGGHSTVRANRSGTLIVDPDRAGAVPGPAGHSRGGARPTCTDANLLLGRISPRSRLSGVIEPDIEAARETFHKNIAIPMAIPVEAAAEGVIEAVNSEMIAAIRRISVQRGYDPREYTLVSFGSAGPQHAAELALELGIPHVLVPRHPGTHSALGMLFADRQKEYAADFSSLLDCSDPAHIDDKYRDLERKALRDLSGEGVPPERIKMFRTVDLKYRGQPFEINMQVPAGKLTRADLQLLNRAFKITHQSEYGFSPDAAGAEIISLKLTAVGNISLGTGDCNVRKHTGRQGVPEPRPLGSRRVIFHGSPVDTPVYSRDDLYPFLRIKGPAVVEQDDTTTVIWPRMSASTDAYGNLIIDVGVK